MLRFVLKRLLYIVFVLLLVSIFIFFLFRLMPGDPAMAMIEGGIDFMTPEQFALAHEHARQLLGLDEPMFMQYFRWLGQLMQGNLGYSAHQRMEVIDVIRMPMINTITMSSLVLILVFLITIPLGVISAIKRGSVFDQSVLVGSMIGFSFPAFLFALIIILVFAIIWQIFPINGMHSPIPPTDFWPMILDRLRFMALPLMTLVLSGTAGMVRFVRAAMLDALSMDFVRTARSKGLTEKAVIYSHAFRNALIPIITVMTGWFIGIFSGSVVIERMFGWNGMGDVMLTSLSNMDFAVVSSMNMFFILIAFVGLLMMDIAYAIADPRIRFD